MTINPVFSCAGLSLTRVWHCFGNYMHRVDMPTVHAMLTASDTNALPINTHNLSENNGRDGLLIGFGDVRYDDLQERAVKMIKMLNINHQTTAGAAIKKTKLAVELTGEVVIKLEVLNPDLKTSNNDALAEAVRALYEWKADLKIMPLLGCNYVDARRLIDLGCCLLRVMGGPIGSGTGLTDPDEFGKICNLEVPVVLDGGVGSPAHFRQAIELGATGCLLNSMLFANGNSPQQNLASFMEAMQPAFQKL